MKNHYVVADSDGFLTMKGDKGDEPERFEEFRAAERWAKKLALNAPGYTIFIYEAVAETCAPVVPPSTTRVYPIEHYKK